MCVCVLCVCVVCVCVFSAHLANCPLATRVVGHRAEVSNPLFNYDRSLIVMAPMEQTCKLWDSCTGTEVISLWPLSPTSSCSPALTSLPEAMRTLLVRLKKYTYLLLSLWVLYYSAIRYVTSFRLTGSSLARAVHQVTDAELQLQEQPTRAEP